MPICRALRAHGVQIAPRTYWASGSRLPSRRALWDTAITQVLAGIYEPDRRGRRRPEALYGSLKMWAYLQRQGIPVAKCTVERLMRASGWRGATRARTDRTTVPRPGDQRAPDLVNRQFTATAPDLLHVADFTYVPMDGGGFGYTALVIDAFAGLVTGWECSLSKETTFAGRAIRQAAALRRRQGRPLAGATIHHSDAGSQGEFNWSSHHLDHGGGRWDGGSRCRRRRRVLGGSGRRIGRCGRRCGHRAALSRLVRCSGSSGG